MAAIIAAVVGFIFLAWFLRRLFPALFAAVIVVAAPVWLVGGLLLDLLRRPLAFLRPLGVGLARLMGFVLVLPLLPFIFVVVLCPELWRQFRPVKSSAPAPAETKTPIQAATQRTADVIDLCAFRQRRSKE